MQDALDNILAMVTILARRRDGGSGGGSSKKKKEKKNSIPVPRPPEVTAEQQSSNATKTKVVPFSPLSSSNELDTSRPDLVDGSKVAPEAVESSSKMKKAKSIRF